jgi:hypothetical protein
MIVHLPTGDAITQTPWKFPATAKIFCSRIEWFLACIIEEKGGRKMRRSINKISMTSAEQTYYKARSSMECRKN